MKSTTIQVVLTVEIQGKEIAACFSFDYSPAEKGGRGRYGEALEPDVAASMTFLEATDEDGGELEVDQDDIHAAEIEAWNEL